jgi:hypothetical protein
MDVHGARGSLVVKALGYKPEGRAFETDEVKFYVYLILAAALGPGVHSASKKKRVPETLKKKVSGE